ncbi:MAG: hypothetical protein ACJA2S_003963 [Cyclobacteriaceae bacterium]|jgi:hypothetical protein
MVLKKSILISLNILVVCLTLYRIYDIDSGKGHLILMFFYPLLIIATLGAKKYYEDLNGFINTLAITMSILFIPILLLIVEYI